MAEFTLVDLHYQLRDLQDFIEERFTEQRELLGRKRGDAKLSDAKLSRTVSWDPKTKEEPEYISVVRSPRQEEVVVLAEPPRTSHPSDGLFGRPGRPFLACLEARIAWRAWPVWCA